MHSHKYEQQNGKIKPRMDIGYTQRDKYSNSKSATQSGSPRQRRTETPVKDKTQSHSQKDRWKKPLYKALGYLTSHHDPIIWQISLATFHVRYKTAKARLGHKPMTRTRNPTTGSILQ